MTPRLDWVDTMRGIAFLMVIYCHLPMMDGRVMALFAPVFLTSFFFISGYLFKSGENFSRVLEQRLRTLMIPFFALGAVMIILGRIMSFHERLPLADEVWGMLMQNGENQILWFVAALFVYSLIFYWIDRVCSTPLRLGVLSAVLFAVNSIALHHWHMPAFAWHVSYAGCACFYMALGRLYRIYEPRISRVLTWPVLGVLLVGYVAAVVATGHEIGHYGSYAVVDSMAVTVAGLTLLIAVSKRVGGRSRLLVFVGTNSLFYFAFHGKAYALILKGLEAVAPGLTVGESFGVNLMVAGAVVIIDALILIYPAKLANRYASRAFGRGFRLW